MGDWSGTVPDIFPGDIPSGAQWRLITDELKAVADPWTSYSSTWRSSGTQPALGNGTLLSVYRRLGKTVDVQILLTIGSTSTFGTGFYSFDLPFTAIRETLGIATAFDTSGGAFFLGAGLMSALGGLPGLGRVTPLTASTNAAWTSAAPFTWATGDVGRMFATYEIA